MKCPYTVNRHTIQQRVFEYNENGEIINETLVEDNTAEYINCLRTECAKFEHGKCCYIARVE